MRKVESIIYLKNCNNNCPYYEDFKDSYGCRCKKYNCIIHSYCKYNGDFPDFCKLQYVEDFDVRD